MSLISKSLLRRMKDIRQKIVVGSLRMVMDLLIWGAFVEAIGNDE